MHILVLAGGPDKEREVSLVSGASVAKALAEAGHEVTQSDIGPDKLDCLDRFARAKGDVIFPVLHGPWGEGGGLQRILDKRGLIYVGSRAPAAELCMDKAATKRVLSSHDLPTPRFCVVSPRSRVNIELPLVLKPITEGSSIDLFICKTADQLAKAQSALTGKYDHVLAEQFVAGCEMTVGVIDTEEGPTALSPIRIVPATAFYDYQAKYTREDTLYLLDPAEVGLPKETLDELRRLATLAHTFTGCRHLSRVDFIVSPEAGPMILEINTLPGFTSHSLLPKAAAHRGMPMPRLVDHLVTLAAARTAVNPRA
ncbi:MAG: D-alanine--D-alanine ligase [Phycisphaera sp.]|nr:D-alanine--D-alanine ligase [Phycisphaera sp.]